MATSWKYSHYSLHRLQLTVLDWLPDIFHTQYRDILHQDDVESEDIRRRWCTVRPGLERSLTTTSLHEIPPRNSRDMEYIDNVLGVQIPRLDRTIRDRFGDEHIYLSLKHRVPVITKSPLPTAKETETATRGARNAC